MARMPNYPRFQPNDSRVVEILVFPAVQLLDVAGPLQVFASANTVAVATGRTAPYRSVVVAAGGTVVTTSAGLGLVVEPLPDRTTAIDTLIVAGGPGVEAASTDPAVLDWLKARAAGARRVASVCTGAFLLGAVGLLNGRRAATHWTRCAELVRQFPAAQVDANSIFVRDGPVWSSAGVTAGIDLALALVEQDLGREIAMAVARNLVVFLRRPGGQAQFSAIPPPDSDDRFARLHVWIGRNLAGDLSLAALAQESGMSERSFTRHYVRTTGLTPAKAVERLRVEGARRLLTETLLPVKSVAGRCGFASEETFRRSFVRLLAVTPQDYRGRFSA